MNNKAAIPNPYLKPLSVLVGVWKTVGRHPYVSETELHGMATFEWIDNGAFMKMSTTIDHPEFPDGLALFGSDDESRRMHMLYFDERGVSRKHEVSFKDGVLKWWRDDPKFSQRFTVKIASDGNAMSGKGEMCRDGKTWEGDLNLTYLRVG